jgi:hypothetical protein
MARITTFHDDESAVEAVLLEVRGSLCIVRLYDADGPRVVRHVSRVTALDDEAREVLARAVRR